MEQPGEHSSSQEEEERSRGTGSNQVMHVIQQFFPNDRIGLHPTWRDNPPHREQSGENVQAD